jgi:hypothetical protein
MKVSTKPILQNWGFSHTSWCSKLVKFLQWVLSDIEMNLRTCLLRGMYIFLSPNESRRDSGTVIQSIIYGIVKLPYVGTNFFLWLITRYSNVSGRYDFMLIERTAMMWNKTCHCFGIWWWRTFALQHFVAFGCPHVEPVRRWQSNCLMTHSKLYMIWC